MSYHIQRQSNGNGNSNGNGHFADPVTEGRSDLVDEETFDDWIDPDAARTKSLFSPYDVFQTQDEALKHDLEANGFDLKTFCVERGIDFQKRIRLINWIRSTLPSPASVVALTGEEELFSDDQWNREVLPFDNMLQLDLEDWDSEFEDENVQIGQDLEASRTNGSTLAQTEEDRLRHQLHFTQERLQNLQALIQASETAVLATTTEADDERDEVALRDKPPQDEDSHYFESYQHNDIHEIMLKDHVRTASYAQFILSNPNRFKDAIVLDIGCGSGILSLLAARAGAKHVYAVDASNVAQKAAINFQSNPEGSRITLIRGKMEEVKLPVEKVDIIISEWMGYCLTYENMLPSVLFGRDRYLRDGGLVVPSQCRMVLAAMQDDEMVKHRLRFWDDVYGFKMSDMVTEMYDEALITEIDHSTLISDHAIVKDLPLQTITVPELNFSAPFNIKVTKDSNVHAFVLWFDTFFNPSGENVPLDVKCNDMDPPTEEALRFLRDPPGALPVSFTTGPMGKPTHWKQTVFLLRSPMVMRQGQTISGTFFCRQSATNSRELDVEIHWCNSGNEKGGVDTVQTFKVR